jgi:hypothetical protein
MTINEIIGYVLSGLGLAGIVASSSKVQPLIPIIKSIPSKYILIGAVVLIVAGIVVVISSSSSSSGNVKQAEEEVPIYEGEGKKRKIVGYKRAK